VRLVIHGAAMPSAFRRALSLAVVVAGVSVAAAPARAVVVERVVAVIGDRPILLSELRSRAKPFLFEIAKKMPPGPQQAAAESQIFKELLEKMIDDELEGQSADKAHVTVTSDEIDAALKNLAGMQGFTIPELIRNAQRSGLTEQDYRDELRRQLLEGKMLQLRVKGRVRITEEDVKAMYERTLKEERKRREFRPRWIVLRVPVGSSREAVLERQALATEIVRRARAGEDFGSMAKLYSDDTRTRDIGGDLDVRAPHGSPQAQANKRPTLAPELDNIVFGLEPGQVTDPIKIADAIVVLQLAERQASRYTTYEAAKNEMLQRLQTEILEKAKRKWLEELKAHTHLDVRL
jgi:peptidyl-prolyl cis-trans isomerase SurA